MLSPFSRLLMMDVLSFVVARFVVASRGRAAWSDMVNSSKNKAYAVEGSRKHFSNSEQKLPSYTLSLHPIQNLVAANLCRCSRHARGFKPVFPKVDRRDLAR
jgi:hypothetical protein